MSVRARPPAADPSAATAEGGDESASQPDAAGRLLARLSVLPALLAMAWLLAGLPLLLAGEFRPAPMLAISVPAAAILVWLGLRWTPGCSQPALPWFKPEHARTPWWAVAGVVVIAVVFGAEQLIYHSQFIIVMRDPASYVNFASWISHHGSLPIPQDRAAFGGTHPALAYNSFAFYQVGTSVVPQFMAGLPMVIASAFWVGGVKAAVLVSPVLGACGVLTFGGLTARLVGPRWAPLAALILALSLPEVFTSRSDYSEPLAQILFLGGLCLVVDALNRDGTAARVIMAIAGLALGLTLLVRIDGVSDVLPVIPYAGLLLLGRRPQALPLLGGLIAGGIYGAVDGIALSRPYLSSIKSSLLPLVAFAALVIVITLIILAVRWRRGVPNMSAPWLANAVSGLVVLGAAGFTLRPYFQTVRIASSPSYEATMAGYQRANHLTVDPTRMYYELSMHWVFWYIGVPAVIAATLGAALLSRRCLAGRAPAWILPLVTFSWTIVAGLYQPSITPDQPWASRRFVPAVLPGFILLAVWAYSWVAGHLRRMNLARLLYAGIAAVCIAALLVPAAITTFGLRPRHGGPLGVKVVAEGLAFTRTYQNEIGAVSGLCAGIPGNSTVVFINGPAADRLLQVVRGMCGEPAARMIPRHEAVQKVLQGIVQAGRHPVLLAASRSALTPYGGQIRRIMRLRTTIDESTLTKPPLHNWPYRLNIWMSEPSP